MRTTGLLNLVIAALVSVALTGPLHAESPQPVDKLIYFFDPPSAELLEGAEKQDFLPLMAAFVSEYQATFCGVASSVMALNALGIERPLSPRWYPYRYWDQDNIFTKEVLEKVKPVSGINADGITLEQLQTLLNLSGAKTDKTFASETGVDAFRKAARAAIADPDAILDVNFGRAELGQPGIAGGGHISPVAAYNAKTDRFLILDVARYKFPPSWVTAERLYAAMNTPDSSSGKTRGYVIVRK